MLASERKKMALRHIKVLNRPFYGLISDFWVIIRIGQMPIGDTSWFVANQPSKRFSLFRRLMPRDPEPRWCGWIRPSIAISTTVAVWVEAAPRMRISHTPYPWAASFVSGRNPRGRVHILTQDKIIADLYLESEEDRANLQIIRAAPWLLEVAERMLPYLRILAEHSEGARRCLDEASRAISSAYGVKTNAEAE